MTGFASAVLLLCMTVAASSSSVVLRYLEGDVVHNTTTCSSDGPAYTTTVCRCPEASPTFLQVNCSCVPDAALLAECDLQLNGGNGSVIPVLFANESSQTLHILDSNNTMAIIGFKHNSRTVRCDSVENVTEVSGQHLPQCNFTVNNNSLQIMGPQEHDCTGLYRLHLNCSIQDNSTNKCLLFKLVNSSQVAAESLTNDTCQRIPFMTTISPSSPSSPSATPEVLSIWCEHNKLLTYVVVGGGCGVGLVLMLIILLCLLAGCVASKNRKKARSRHQLNTALGRRSHHSTGRHNPHLRQTLTYSITNLPEITEVENSDPFESIMPQESQAVVVQADAPPAPRRDVDDEHDVTFDTFKRRGKGHKPQTEQTPPDIQPQEENKLVPVLMPTVPKVNTKPPQLVTPTDREQDIPSTPPLKPRVPKLTILQEKQACTIASQPSTPEEAYYESVALTTEETYDSLDYQTALTKHSLNSSSHYSQLNNNNYPSSPPGQMMNHTYSMVTIRSTRTSSSPPPLPPPLSPSYNGLELLGPQKRFNTNILSSSWSRPSHVDHMTSHTDKDSQELDDEYDYPTALAKPTIEKERKRGTVKITNNDTEVIYDVPRSKQKITQ